MVEQKQRCGVIWITPALLGVAWHRNASMNFACRFLALYVAVDYRSTDPLYTCFLLLVPQMAREAEEHEGRDEQASNEKLTAASPATGTRCSRRSRAHRPPSRGLAAAAAAVASVETVSRGRSPAASVGRLPLPHPRRSRLW